VAVKTPAPERAAGRRKLAKAGNALPDGSFPIPNVAYLKKAIRAVGRAGPGKRPALGALIRKRARALGAWNVVKGSWADNTQGAAAMSNALKAALELSIADGTLWELHHTVELATPAPGEMDKVYKRAKARGLSDAQAMSVCRTYAKNKGYPASAVKSPSEYANSGSTIDLVGPKGYVHGWIYVGAGKNNKLGHQAKLGEHVRISRMAGPVEGQVISRGAGGKIDIRTPKGERISSHTGMVTHLYQGKGAPKGSAERNAATERMRSPAGSMKSPEEERAHLVAHLIDVHGGGSLERTEASTGTRRSYERLQKIHASSHSGESDHPVTSTRHRKSTLARLEAQGTRSVSSADKEDSRGRAAQQKSQTITKVAPASRKGTGGVKQSGTSGSGALGNNKAPTSSAGKGLSPGKTATPSTSGNPELRREQGAAAPGSRSPQYGRLPSNRMTEERKAQRKADRKARGETVAQQNARQQAEVDSLPESSKKAYSTAYTLQGKSHDEAMAAARGGGMKIGGKTEAEWAATRKANAKAVTAGLSPTERVDRNALPSNGKRVYDSARTRGKSHSEAMSVAGTYSHRERIGEFKPPAGGAVATSAVSHTDHADLLKARTAARAQYPKGHPERLKAERAVRQSRKTRRAGEGSGGASTTRTAGVRTSRRRSRTATPAGTTSAPSTGKSIEQRQAEVHALSPAGQRTYALAVRSGAGHERAMGVAKARPKPPKGTAAAARNKITGDRKKPPKTANEAALNAARAESVSPGTSALASRLGVTASQVLQIRQLAKQLEERGWSQSEARKIAINRIAHGTPIPTRGPKARKPGTIGAR
jgi:hypothetical protein